MVSALSGYNHVQVEQAQINRPKGKLFLQSCKVNLLTYIQRRFTCSAILENKFLQINQWGNPLSQETIQIQQEQLDTSQLQSNDLIVEMQYSAIHPVDLRIINGAPVHYNFKNQILPSKCGLEGVGKIIEVGGGVEHYKVGELISPNFETNYAAFSKYVKVHSGTKIPDNISLELGAQIYLVPVTLIGILDEFKLLEDETKGWLVQTAANSTVGRALNQYCRMKGINSIGVVRSKEGAQIAKQSGATKVIVAEDFKCAQDYSNAILQATDGEGARYGLDCVSGMVGEGMYNGMSNECVNGSPALMLSYGTLSNQPFDASSLQQKRNNVQQKRFLVFNWEKENSHKLQKHYPNFIDYLQKDQISLPIEKTFQLDNYLEAFKYQMSSSQARSGKIQFKFQ